MDLIESVFQKVSLKDVLEMYGIYPKRGRNNYICFMHNDKHPSAGLTKDGKKFHCFSCGATLGLFDVVQHFEQCDFKTATKILDNKFHLELFKPLSEQEKAELDIAQQRRERLKLRKQQQQDFEQSVLNDIVLQMRICKDALRATHLTRGEYRDGTWENGELFFFALERMSWLNWLYSCICEQDHPDCDFDYFYPTEKNELLKKLYKGEITI